MLADGHSGELMPTVTGKKWEKQLLNQFFRGKWFVIYSVVNYHPANEFSPPYLSHFDWCYPANHSLLPGGRCAIGDCPRRTDE